MASITSRDIARNRNALGYNKKLDAPVEGGTVTGNARRELEHKSGRRFLTKENYKKIPEAVKLKLIKVEED